jgi:TrpR-related protein YerC/YecD
MYESKLKSEDVDRLFGAVLLLRDLEDCYRFFEDVMTAGELSAIAQRLQVAAMLDEGATYQEVATATGASSATISRVNRCLHYGADGYRRMIDRVKAGGA